MRLQASINGLLNAPLSGQGAALIAESIIGWPFITNYQVELSWPLGTVMAEMPRLITSMCSVFHGKIAFPFLSSPIKKSLFCSESHSRDQQIKYCGQGPVRRSCSGFCLDPEIVTLIRMNSGSRSLVGQITLSGVSGHIEHVGQKCQTLNLYRRGTPWVRLYYKRETSIVERLKR